MEIPDPSQSEIQEIISRSPVLQRLFDNRFYSGPGPHMFHLENATAAPIREIRSRYGEDFDESVLTPLVERASKLNVFGESVRVTKELTKTLIGTGYELGDMDDFFKVHMDIMKRLLEMGHLKSNGSHEKRQDFFVLLGDAFLTGAMLKLNKTNKLPEKVVYKINPKRLAVFDEFLSKLPGATDENEGK